MGCESRRLVGSRECCGRTGLAPRRLVSVRVGVDVGRFDRRPQGSAVGQMEWEHELLGAPPYAERGLIFDEYMQTLDWPSGAALSFVLMAAILVLVLLYIRRAGTEELV